MSTVGITQATLWNVNSLVGLEQTAVWDVDAPSSPVKIDWQCNPFRQVNTDFMVEGESRVTWYLKEDFIAPTPYMFQLQVGNTGNPLADDWQNVGPAVSNTFTMTDPARRALGKQLVTHYRVQLTDNADTIYYSLPSTVLGKLNLHYWLVVRDITRQERLKLKKGPGGTLGFLLKKRRDGIPCPRCLDPYTSEVKDSRCPVCDGTGLTAGYFRAVPCDFTDPTNVSVDEQRSSGPEAWKATTMIRGRFVASPLLDTGDIWVDEASDLRYYVETVTVENRISGVPVTLLADLAQLPFANKAYSIPLA